MGSKPSRLTAASSSPSFPSLALQDLGLQPSADLVLRDKEPVVELPGVAEGLEDTQISTLSQANGTYSQQSPPAASYRP
jgi:hypothetical protein